jgi:hypothetical protein
MALLGLVAAIWACDTGAGSRRDRERAASRTEPGCPGVAGPIRLAEGQIGPFRAWAALGELRQHCALAYDTVLTEDRRAVPALALPLGPVLALGFQRNLVTDSLGALRAGMLRDDLPAAGWRLVGTDIVLPNGRALSLPLGDLRQGLRLASVENDPERGLHVVFCELPDLILDFGPGRAGLGRMETPAEWGQLPDTLHARGLTVLHLPPRAAPWPECGG